jgi:hypothetical protein
MQFIIDEVTSRIRATSTEAALSQRTLGRIISAVLDAVEAEGRRSADRAEERSLENYQQRVRPGR